MFSEAGFGSAESSEREGLATFPNRGAGTHTWRKAGVTKAIGRSSRTICAESNSEG